MAIPLGATCYAGMVVLGGEGAHHAAQHLRRNGVVQAALQRGAGRDLGAMAGEREAQHEKGVDLRHAAAAAAEAGEHLRREALQPRAAASSGSPGVDGCGADQAAESALGAAGSLPFQSLCQPFRQFRLCSRASIDRPRGTVIGAGAVTIRMRTRTCRIC